MKKVPILFHLLYYILIPLIYMGFFAGVSALFQMSGQSHNIPTQVFLSVGVVFIGTPVLTILLMRFSLFRWYIDPIAAAEIPLYIYVAMIVKQLQRYGSLSSAFHLTNIDLSDDGGMGFFFLGFLFFLGLLSSFSFTRPKGKSFSYKLVGRLWKCKIQ